MDQSSQHGPRIDDELEALTQDFVRGAPVGSRAEEEREIQSTAPAGTGPVTPEADWTTARSELARHLRPSAFPADRQTLLSVAQAEHAPPAVMADLALAPSGRAFANVAELWEVLHGERERRARVPAHERPPSEVQTSPGWRETARRARALPVRALVRGASLTLDVSEKALRTAVAAVHGVRTALDEPRR
jgi:hypothetical protein